MGRASRAWKKWPEVSLSTLLPQACGVQRQAPESWPEPAPGSQGEEGLWGSRTPGQPGPCRVRK